MFRFLVALIAFLSVIPAEGQIFSDSFTGTAGASITARTSDSGGSWEKHDLFSSADIVTTGSGTAYGAATCVMVTNNLAVGDCRIEGTFNVKSSGDTAYGALMLRASKASASWALLGINNNDGKSFFGYDTNYFTGFAGSTASTFNPYYAVGSHSMMFSVTGTGTAAMYRGWIDKREVYRWGSGLADTGRIGIVNGGSISSTTGNHFDSFTAYSTAASPRNQVQFVGDSMTWGAYNSGGSLLNVGWDVQWPADVMARIYATGGDADWTNAGASGKTINSIYSTRATTNTSDQVGIATTPGGVAPAGWGWINCRRPAAAKDIVVLMGGINDIASNGQSGEGAYTDFAACVTAAKAAGFTVIALTNPLLEEGVHTAFTVPAGTNAKLTTLNNLIIANSAAADYVVDMTGDTRISGSTANATYRAGDDGVHWLAPAQPIVADYVYPAVAAAMGLNSGRPGFIRGGNIGPFKLGPYFLTEPDDSWRNILCP